MCKLFLLILFVCLVKSEWQYGSIPSNNDFKYVTGRYEEYKISETRSDLKCGYYPIEAIIDFSIPPKDTIYNEYVNGTAIVENLRVKTIKIYTNRDSHFYLYACILFDLADILSESFETTFNVLNDDTLFGLIYWPHRVPLLSINSRDYLCVQFYNDTHLGITIDFKLKSKKSKKSEL